MITLIACIALCAGRDAMELSIPNKAGRYLDDLMPGWRRYCVVNAYSHAKEDWEEAGEGLHWVHGQCEHILRLREQTVAPDYIIDGRCPSPSSKNKQQTPS